MSAEGVVAGGLQGIIAGSKFGPPGMIIGALAGGFVGGALTKSEYGQELADFADYLGTGVTPEEIAQDASLMAQFEDRLREQQAVAMKRNAVTTAEGGTRGVALGAEAAVVGEQERAALAARAASVGGMRKENIQRQIAAHQIETGLEEVDREDKRAALTALLGYDLGQLGQMGKPKGDTSAITGTASATPPVVT